MQDIFHDKYGATAMHNDSAQIDLDLMNEQLELEQALARLRQEQEYALMSDDRAMTNKASRWHDLKRAERDLKVRLKMIIEMRECR